MASATALQEGILSDVGGICKRLLNHRPVIQNEVHFFVKEFENKREDSDLRLLQDSMRKANEMDAVYLEAIVSASPQFRQIREKADEINATANDILKKEQSELTIPQAEQDQFDRQLEECRSQLQERQQTFDTQNSEEVERLKREIEAVRESRVKLRSVTSSVSSGVSVTLYPSASPSSGEDSSQSASPQPKEGPGAEEEPEAKEQGKPKTKEGGSAAREEGSIEQERGKETEEDETLEVQTEQVS